MLTDSGLPALLRAKEDVAAVLLAAKCFAEAFLRQQRTLRVVLPSASRGVQLPNPTWLAHLHVHKMLAASHMQILCCGQKHVLKSLLPNTDTPYLAAYTNALQSALLPTAAPAIQ